jgi:hypothetical protein
MRSPCRSVNNHVSLQAGRRLCFEIDIDTRAALNVEFLVSQQTEIINEIVNEIINDMDFWGKCNACVSVLIHAREGERGEHTKSE